eukprot:5770800-Pyramimonas_sp.AAC.1
MPRDKLRARARARILNFVSVIISGPAWLTIGAVEPPIRIQNQHGDLRRHRVQRRSPAPWGFRRQL